MNSAITLDFIANAEHELIAGGKYGIGDNGHYYISTSDKQNLSYHHDKTRMNGCCGPSPEGLPNLLCVCKSEIGREVTDCCTTHYIILYKTGIALQEDNTGLLEEVLSLPIAEDIKKQYEMLIRFGETESVLNALSR
jgi:hypothetical protein